MSNKIIHLLSSLSSTEAKQFAAYVNYCGQDESSRLSRTLQFIRDQQFEQPIDKEQLHRLLFPGKPYTDLTIRHLISALTGILEDFFAIRELMMNKSAKEVYLLRALRKRNLEKAFYAETRAYQKRQLRHPDLVDPQFFLNHYLFNQEILLFQEQSSRNEDMNLEALSNDLDNFYVLSKLKTACNMLIHEGLVQKKYDCQLISEVVEFVEKAAVFHHRLIEVYYNYYKALTASDNEIYFRKIRDILGDRNHGFSMREQRDVYLLLINFCIRKFNQGEAVYIHELFSIYKEALGSGAMYTRKKLTPFTFKNIVSAGLYIKEYDWTKDFIEKFKNKLDDQNRNSIVALSLAKLYYEQGHYESVLEILRTSQIKDLYLKLNGKVMQIRTFYDMGEYDLALSHVENFQLFLRREKMMTYHKTNYINYVKCLKKMLSTNAHDKAEIANLRKYIEDIQILSEKKWLLQRVDRL